MTKRLNPAISECHVCGVTADEQCVSLRTGKPIKHDHQGGRYLQVGVVNVAQLDPSKLPPAPPNADQWAGDCTELFKQLPGVKEFLGL